MEDHRECMKTLNAFLTGGDYARSTLLPNVMPNILKEYKLNKEKAGELLASMGIEEEERNSLLLRVVSIH